MVAPHKIYEGLREETLPREFGRRVLAPETGQDRLAALRSIVATDEPARVDGVFVDPKWARMLAELYEDLSDERRRKLAETPIQDVGALLKSWSSSL